MKTLLFDSVRVLLILILLALAILFVMDAGDSARIDSLPTIVTPAPPIANPIALEDNGWERDGEVGHEVLPTPTFEIEALTVQV